MIRLTRLNSQPLTLNSDLIKFVEQSPDTLITLITGEQIVVKETPADVLALLIAFRRSVLQGLSLTWDSSWNSSAAHTLPPRPIDAGRYEPEK